MSSIIQKKILITAGPTREMLDPVRFISNLSTGEMGYALARAARSKKYQVTLISGPVTLKAPPGVRLVSIVSARDLQKACRRLFPQHDALIMTAAVCDFTAASRHRHKIHRIKTRRLSLKQTPDIVAGLARGKGKRKIIGFCLETQDWIENAARKLARKHLDGMVANSYRAGHVPFGNRRITAALIAPQGRPVYLKNHSKGQIAAKVLSWLNRL